MSEFLLLFRNQSGSDGKPPTKEQMQAMMQQWQAWIQGVAKKGNYSGTNRLLNDGKLLKSKSVVNDGPYVEGKEVIGGYLLIKASSMDQAVEIAKGCPIFNFGGTVEVRPVLTINSDVNSDKFLEGVQ